jgi:LacI family transcriptional regulator
MVIDALQKKKITMLEIARAANVSKATVSLVLNDSPNPIPISEATRQRVIEAARQLGYRPNAAAKALATGKSSTILMVAFDLWDENLVERLRGAEAHLVPSGYSLRMCTVDAKGGLNSCSEILRTGQADGVLLTGMATVETYPVLHSLREEAVSAGLPVIALADAFPQVYVGSVAAIDDERGAEEAVTHLIEHGHRRILFLGVADVAWAASRRRGYEKAHEKAGITIVPELIVIGDRSQTWSYETTLKLVDSVDFTAMFAITDNMAVAAMSALKAAGKRVPEDCAIIGFDNNDKVARYTDPPLTTVDNPFYETGKLAAEMLIDMIESRPPKSVTLPVSLVIRQSCGCPAK